MTKEALKLAHEALTIQSDRVTEIGKKREAITAIKEALAQPEQEPVAWWSAKLGVFDEKHFDQLQPLYTTPPKRPWVGLTDVEWMNIVNKDQAWFGQRPDEVAHEVAKLVEAKLKEKNFD